jgi:hypothetical protein
LFGFADIIVAVITHPATEVASEYRVEKYGVITFSERMQKIKSQVFKSLTFNEAVEFEKRIDVAHIACN